MFDLLVVVGCFGAFALVVCLLFHFWPQPPPILLDGKRKSVQILDVRQLSPDTRLLRISTGDKHTALGLPTGQHLKIYGPNPPECIGTGRWNGTPDRDGEAEISRTYTPITGNDTVGFVDIMVKCYEPGTVTMPDGTEVRWEDGGKMSRYLHQRKPGDHIEVCGPVGLHNYIGRGSFIAAGKMLDTNYLCLLAGGVGITPMLQLIRASVADSRDSTKLTLLYANKTEDDILGRDLLDTAVSQSKGRVRVDYTLDKPPEKWDGRSGFISTAMCRDLFVKPIKKPLILICGPTPMVEACKRSLQLLGYPKERCIAL